MKCTSLFLWGGGCLVTSVVIMGCARQETTVGDAPTLVNTTTDDEALEIASLGSADTEIAERFAQGNRAVLDATIEDPSLAGMGTTLTLGVFETDGTLRIGTYKPAPRDDN